MTAIRSAGMLTAVDRNLGSPTLAGAWLPGGGSTGWAGLMADYGAIWRTQPQVRKVVGFLARNIASLNVTLYRRVSATDRERVDDHELALALRHPAGWRNANASG